MKAPIIATVANFNRVIQNKKGAFVGRRSAARGIVGVVADGACRWLGADSAKETNQVGALCRRAARKRSVVA